MPFQHIFLCLKCTNHSKMSWSAEPELRGFVMIRLLETKSHSPTGAQLGSMGYGTRVKCIVFLLRMFIANEALLTILLY